jgi:hypothetical protein
LGHENPVADAAVHIGLGPRHRHEGDEHAKYRNLFCHAWGVWLFVIFQLEVIYVEDAADADFT